MKTKNTILLIISIITLWFTSNFSYATDYVTTSNTEISIESVKNYIPNYEDTYNKYQYAIEKKYWDTINELSIKKLQTVYKRVTPLLNKYIERKLKYKYSTKYNKNIILLDIIKNLVKRNLDIKLQLENK